MKINSSAQQLLDAFDKWISESSKTVYQFSEEEQLCLQNMISMLDAQVDMLVKYELEKRKEQ